MIYLLEAKTKKSEGLIEELTEKEKKAIKLLDRYDPIVKLSTDVERIGLAMKRFKESGIDWDIFRFYLKGRGIPSTTIDGVMGKVNEFFSKIGILPPKN